MGWISLTSRKKDLRSSVNENELRKIELSRELRQVHRQLSYEQSILNIEKNTLLEGYRNTYEAARNAFYADTQNPALQAAYDAAKEEYELNRKQALDLYDIEMEEQERIATDQEESIIAQQDTLETQLQVMRQEMDSIAEGIQADIESQKLNFK